MKQITLLLATLLFSTTILAEEAILYIRGLSVGTTVYLDGEKIGKIDQKGRLIYRTTTGQHHLQTFKNGKVWNEVIDQRVLIATPITNLNLIPPKIPLDLDDFFRGYMTTIPEGIFEMGDLTGNGASNEKPVHLVKVPAFKMGKIEVPFALYDQYLLATNQQPSKRELGHAYDNEWGRGDRPAINISWEDAQEFIQWLNETLQPEKPYRLPSEAEWEYAARAGTETDFWWGNQIVSTNKANCPGCGSERGWLRKTVPVTSFSPNPYGLYNTAGNVAELVEDCYEWGYHNAPTNGSAVTGVDNCMHVLRGGSWFARYREARVSARTKRRSDYRWAGIGFRLAQDL